MASWNAQESRSIVRELANGIVNVVERQVGRALLETAEGVGIPAPRQRFQGADVEIAVMKVAFELGHFASEKATILADAVAAHRRGAAIDPARQELQRPQLRLASGRRARAYTLRQPR